MGCRRERREICLRESKNRRLLDLMKTLLQQVLLFLIIKCGQLVRSIVLCELGIVSVLLFFVKFVLTSADILNQIKGRCSVPISLNSGFIFSFIISVFGILLKL